MTTTEKSSKPATIGRITDLDAFRAHPVGPGHPYDMRSLWAPYDDVHGALLALVNSCKRELVIAMFGFTDTELGAAVKAKLEDPGIHCQVTLDRTQAAGPTEREMLASLGLLESNSVVVGSSERGAIMHRKVMIVDRRFTVTGSTNWSMNAEVLQDNQASVHESAAVAAEAGIVLGLEHTKALTKAGR